MVGTLHWQCLQFRRDFGSVAIHLGLVGFLQHYLSLMRVDEAVYHHRSKCDEAQTSGKRADDFLDEPLLPSLDVPHQLNSILFVSHRILLSVYVEVDCEKTAR